MDIGERIKSIRQNKKMSREDLATKLGVSKFTIAKYEQGQRWPNIKILKEIATALEVPFSELAGEKSHLKETDKAFSAAANDENITEEEMIKKLMDTDFGVEILMEVLDEEKKEFIKRLKKESPQIDNYINNFKDFKKDDLINIYNSMSNYYLSVIETFIGKDYRMLSEKYYKIYEAYILSSERIKSQDETIKKYQEILDKFVANNNEINRILANNPKDGSKE